MKPTTVGLLEELEAADLFSQVGQPPDEARRGKAIFVGSWDEAIACCSSLEWENFSLEQRNHLTMFLHENASDRYQRWNDIVDEIKDALTPIAERKMSSFLGTPGSREAWSMVGNSVRWDVVGACMELEYAEIRDPGFFCGLMSWYLDGRFPCGWGEIGDDGRVRLAGPVDESGHDPANPDMLELVLSYQEHLYRPRIKMPAGKLVVF